MFFHVFFAYSDGSLPTVQLELGVDHLSEGEKTFRQENHVKTAVELSDEVEKNR